MDLVTNQNGKFFNTLEEVPTNILLESRIVEYIADRKSRIAELGNDYDKYLKVAQLFLNLLEDRELYEECAELVNLIPELQK